MNFNHFGEATLHSVEKAFETIEAIDPILQDLKEDYSEGDLIDTSDVTMMAAAKDYDKPSEVRLSSAEVQRALGFMAFNDVIELKGDNLYLNTSNRHKEFFIDTYDPERCDDLVDYLNSEYESYVRDGVDRTVEHDFSNFENFV